MPYKLIRKEYTSTTLWYDVDLKLSEEDITQIEELYAGDIDAFLDNKQSINEGDAYYGGEVVREKDSATEVEWLIVTVEKK
jgi:hypothetical protein